jgi:4'-phosphopantetheinyl transferase
MATGDLDIWYYRIPPSGSRLMLQSDAWLDAFERERAERLVDARVRDRYRVAHQFLRWVLASYLDCAETDIDIGRDARGKPALATPDTRLRFSLSHAGDGVAVAVGCDCEVGIDIEWTRAMPNGPGSTLFGLAAAFDEEDSAALRALPSPVARREVVRLWTLKEALAKAVGTGLALPLRAAGFPVREVFVAGRPLRYPGVWSFHCQPLPGGGWLSAAIAARAGRTRLMTLAATLARSARDSVIAVDRVARTPDGIPRRSSQAGP